MTSLLLAALFVKHFLCDFPLQTQSMLWEKRFYFKWGGWNHSLNHGVGTGLVMYLFLDSAVLAFIFFVLDTLIHFHIDYAKANWGPHDPKVKGFWNWLGADQLAHALTYIMFVDMLT